MQFGGFNRNDDSIIHSSHEVNGKPMLKLYIPGRSAIVVKKLKNSG